MESRALNITLNVVKFGIGLIGVILLGSILVGNNEYVDSALKLAYVAMGIAAASSILFSAAMFVIRIKRSFRALIGIAVFGIALLIAYNVASPEVLSSWKEMPNATPEISQWVGGGIISFYILLAGAIVAILFNEVVTLFK